MVGLNKIMVIGNVGTEPEMRYVPSGSPVTSFRIAVSRTYNARDGERREETEWFTVSAWNALAEQVNNYLRKGRRAYVEGRLRSQSFSGNDGQPRFRNEIVANQILFLDRPGSGESSDEFGTGSGGSGSDFGPPAALSPDDLPF